jgi:hypothetical protein
MNLTDKVKRVSAVAGFLGLLSVFQSGCTNVPQSAATEVSAMGYDQAAQNAAMNGNLRQANAFGLVGNLLHFVAQGQQNTEEVQAAQPPQVVYQPPQPVVYQQPPTPVDMVFCYVCNEWKDDNGNNLTEPDELKGRGRASFGRNEPLEVGFFNLSNRAAAITFTITNLNNHTQIYYAPLAICPENGVLRSDFAPNTFTPGVYKFSVTYEDERQFNSLFEITESNNFVSTEQRF